MSLSVEILVTEDCPHAEEAIREMGDVLDHLVPGIRPEVQTVTTPEEAQKLEFPGSPTIRVNGVDLEGADVGPPALACRRYGTQGVPPR